MMLIKNLIEQVTIEGLNNTEWRECQERNIGDYHTHGVASNYWKMHAIIQVNKNINLSRLFTLQMSLFFLDWIILRIVILIFLLF